MTERVIRAMLVALAVVGVVTGLWAAFAPRGFYDDFPGGGRSWVSADGPYNEHLVRDFGALNLALAAVTIVALVTLARPAVVAAALAWLVFGVLHLVYHARHLDVYDTGDKVGTMAALAVGVALPLVVLVAVLPRRRTT
ncbi:MAG TPA: hypothetical protein VGJ43_08635 [Acidimicrobiales bacterium]|jgi:hypothetical protein